MIDISPGKNLGVIEQVRPSDWVAGVSSSIVYAINVLDGQWKPYQSAPERQGGVYFDSMACVSFSAVKSVVLQLNWMIATGKITAATLARCQELGYLNSAGRFDFSERYVAKMSGTTKDGNSAGAVWDAIRKYGLVPQGAWPFPDAQRTPVFDWDDFYAEVPEEIIKLGQEFLKLFNIAYERIADTTAANLTYHLKQAPIQILTYTCPPWNTTDVIQACGAHPSTHATVLAGATTDGNWLDLDTYSPFEKRLANDYQINFAFKGVVTEKPMDHLNIKDNMLCQLVDKETTGGFGWYRNGKLYIDDLAKLIASWEVVRNQTLLKAVAEASNFSQIKGALIVYADSVQPIPTLKDWNAFPHFNLKNEPLP